METSTVVSGAEVATVAETEAKAPEAACVKTGRGTPKLRQVQMPSTVAERLTFGVEVETVMPVQAMQDAGIRRGGYHCGLPLPQPMFPAGWEAQSDSSIPVPAGGWVGIEVVSPVLHGREGLEQVSQVLDRLRTLGCAVRRGMGLHVHLGVESAAGADRAAQAAFVENFVSVVAQFETALYAITGSAWRRTNHYCATVRTDGHRAAVERVRRAAKGRKWQALHDGHLGRYHSVNTQNVGSYNRNTVEVRALAASLNPIKVLASVQFILGLAEKALGRRARFDPPVTRIYRGRGDGTRQVERALSLLGWSLGRKDVGRETCVALGWLDDLANLAAAKAELRRLARKFDAAVAAEALPRAA